MRRAPTALIALVAMSCLGSGLDAQTSGLAIRAGRRDTITARATVTAPFVVSNQRSDSVTVLPHVEAPKDWTILMGTTAFVVRARSIEILMLSLAVPSRAPAGVYPIRVWVTTPADPRGIMDSVVVVIPQRRALDVGLVEKPGYVVSGKTYDAGFLLRNRGNTMSEVKLSARSSLGVATIVDTAIQLYPEESRVVRVNVRTPEGLQAATDDVLELAATQVSDSATVTEGSARVTVVPEPSRKIDAYLRVPTQLHLRAASTDGVSPFEAFGRGPVRDGSPTQLDFLVRGRTGVYSAFGERDEYRAELSAPSWRARLGDQVYMHSSLTSSAQPGFGAGLDGTRGIFTMGGYGQQFRRLPEKGSETGAFVSARPRSDARVAVNVVNRAGGYLPGKIGSASVSLDRTTYNAEIEVARSQSPTGGGLARSARLSGATSVGSYDIGHLFADTAFAGTQRGSEHDYLAANGRYSDALSFGVNGSTHRTDLSRATGVPYIERFSLGTVSATVFDRYTLELGSVARATTIQGVVQKGNQNGVRARGDQENRYGTVTLEVEAGKAREPGALARVYSDVSLGARRSFTRGAFALWADTYSGGSITKGTDGSVTFGGDLSMRLSRTIDATLMGYGTRLKTPISTWHSQLDAQIAHTLPNGNTVTLRARLIGGSSLPTADQSVAYIEYGMPLRLPVSRLRTPGRVYGRVVDAVTGRGVPGALVRLGPQVAITDKEGQVAFGGVPGGEHRVSMSQETSFANAVFVGDPTLRVDSTRTQPTTFELAIARSARLDIGVRRFAAVRTGIANSADSLADAGPLANATLVLSGERDTLYRTTGDNGAVTFTDVPPGRWIVTIRGDAPAFHRFDPDRVELTLAPGETKALSFRLVPRKRDVQLIGEGQELRPMTAEPKSLPANTIRTGKPNDRPQQN